MKNFSILEIPQFFLVLVVVAMVVVINSVIGGFGGKDSVSLDASTIRLQVSDYNCTE